MPPLSFSDARALVLREVRAGASRPPSGFVSLETCAGLVLAEDAAADRDYPPFNRATRDGFAVCAADLPGHVRVIGEARAGCAFDGVAGPGEAIEIMTGAPVPAGADAVVMVEHCTLSDGIMSTERATEPGANIAPAGCEARAGAIILTRGTRLDYSHIGWLATIGWVNVPVYRKPSVAILATGDEIVEVGAIPGPTQIRNSNTCTLAAQVRRAGGEPLILPVAPDDQAATAELIRRGLEADLLLLSGGVSAGKYDFVEPALAQFGAHFFFDRVLIQPGQPLVFGQAAGKFFFGLPGNPASTMVTFELFARAAIDILSGCDTSPLPLTTAALTRPFRHKTGLTRFLPAVVSHEHGSPAITPVAWQGSGDVPSICRANCYLVADAAKPEYATGEQIPVLLK